MQPEVPRSPGDRPSSLRFLSPVAQSTPWASPAGYPTPVITRNPRAAVPTPSLEWDFNPATTQLGLKNIPEGETPGIILSSGGFLLEASEEGEEVITLEERVGVIEGVKPLKGVQEMVTPLSMDLKRMNEENVHLRGKILKPEALADVNSDDGSRVMAMAEKLEGWETGINFDEFEKWMSDEELKQRLEHILMVLEIYWDELEMISISNYAMVQAIGAGCLKYAPQIKSKMDAFVKKLNASGEMGKAVTKAEEFVMYEILRWKSAVAKYDESSPGNSEEEELATKASEKEKSMLDMMGDLRRSRRLAEERKAVQKAIRAESARKAREEAALKKEAEVGEENSPANEVEGEEKPETEEAPDAASYVSCTEQLKSQDNLQATCEVGEPVHGVTEDPELPALCPLGGEVVTAIVQDMEKEAINKSLALACTIYIMGSGVYEEAGVSKNLAMIPVAGSEEKTQGDGKYYEATYGESHEERVIDDHDPVTAEVSPHLLLPTEQRSHDSGVEVVRMFEDNQSQGLDEKACYEVKIKSYDDTGLTIASAATLALMACVTIKTNADPRVSAVVDMVTYVDKDGCSQGIPAEVVEDVYRNTEVLRELGDEMPIKSEAVINDPAKKESVDEPVTRLVCYTIQAEAADLEGLEIRVPVEEAVAGVKLFMVTDKVPPDKEGLDKSLEDTGGEDAKKPNSEANAVKKESSDNDAGKKSKRFPMVGNEEELGGKPQAPSQPAGVASRIILSGDGFPSGGEEVTNQEANVADKELVGNGGMMWLPKMDVVSVQIPQPQFERVTTCHGTRVKSGIWRILKISQRNQLKVQSHLEKKLVKRLFQRNIHNG